MPRSLRRALLGAVLFGAALGCTRSVVQQNKQPPDPLLISKKPVEGKPTSATNPRVLARVDPQPPEFSTENTSYTAVAPGAPVQLSSELVVCPGQ